MINLLWPKVIRVTGFFNWLLKKYLLKNAITNVPSYTLNFIGKQPGRWRVKSFSKATGKAGVYSEWREFTYLK